MADTAVNRRIGATLLDPLTGAPVRLRLGGLPPLPGQPADLGGECWRRNHDGCEGYTEQQNNDPTDIDLCICECHDLEDR